MNQISNINGLYQVIPTRQGRTGTSEAPHQSGQGNPRDEVEISEVGALLARADDRSGIRLDKVARIRVELDAGTFETPERIEGTVDRLLEELWA